MSGGDSYLPRINLSARSVDAIYADAGLPVREVQIVIREEDWDEFLAMAHLGMEIPVRVEGEDNYITAVLAEVHDGHFITVVI